MTTPRMIELAAAVLLLVAGVFFYRRRDRSDTYGSQGAVILFVVGAIVAIHALSLMEYHPTAAEADMIKARVQ
jgi:hypothetical protein